MGRKRTGGSETVDVFGPYSGGDVNELVGDKKKALEFTVVSEKLSGGHMVY